MDVFAGQPYLTPTYMMDRGNGTYQLNIEESLTYGVTIHASSNVKYDLVDKPVDETGLTRKTVLAILKGIQPSVFNQFKDNPDRAIAFYEGTVKHIYFVAETKGSMSSMQLRLIEQSKLHCAREHFKAISGDNVVYDVVDSYRKLMEKVMK